MAILKVQFSLRMDPVIYAKLKKISEENNRSASNMINYIILEMIKKYESENGKIELVEEEIYDL